jgi:hypothetical protein
VNCNRTIIGNQTYTFTDNGSYIFNLIDEYGNTGSTTATVYWIDKTPVNAVPAYSPAAYSTGYITVTVTLNTTGSMTQIPD